MGLGIHCCKDCPDRIPGCHSKCQKYQTEKAQYERDKAKVKAEIDRLPRMSKHEFDMLKCMHGGRGKH